MSLKNAVGLFLSGSGVIGMYVIGAIIHVWTIIIAFTEGGILYAAPTIVFPVVAQIYWFIKVWYSAGTILNPYCLANIIYPVCFGLIFLGVSMFAPDSTTRNEKKQNTFALTKWDAIPKYMIFTVILSLHFFGLIILYYNASYTSIELRGLFGSLVFDAVFLSFFYLEKSWAKSILKIKYVLHMIFLASIFYTTINYLKSSIYVLLFTSILILLFAVKYTKFTRIVFCHLLYVIHGTCFIAGLYNPFSLCTKTKS